MSSSPIVLPPLDQLPTPNVSDRGGVTPNLLVLHETAGSYAGACSWLCNPKAQASAHLVLREDGLRASQLVPLDRKAWSQCHFNPRGVSLELANTTAKGYATDHQLRVAARIFGWLIAVRGLASPRWSRDGATAGVCRHLDLGAAGCGHTQCGPSDDGWALFLGYLHHELARGDFRRSWAL
jgi:hypothetical protein